MTTNANTSPLLLIPGHWLGAWAWNEVLEQLQRLNVQAEALTLPGLDMSDPHRDQRTLTDQVEAIEHAIRSGAKKRASKVVLVAHSGANAPVTMVLDRNRDLIDRVIWVDSGPAQDGSVFAPDFPEGAGGLELPSFDVLGQQASLEGLDEATKARFSAHAVAEPAGVMTGTVSLRDESRFGVPASFICCSMSGETVRSLAANGHPMFAEVCRYVDVEYFDLPTGHWPMWSEPEKLAQALNRASRRPGKSARP